LRREFKRSFRTYSKNILVTLLCGIAKRRHIIKNKRDKRKRRNRKKEEEGRGCIGKEKVKEESNADFREINRGV
jgi:hypothetical protein